MCLDNLWITLEHDRGINRRGGSVPANIEYRYIRDYGLTTSVYSNLRVFQESYIRIYGFFGHFVKLFEAHTRLLSYEFLRCFFFPL